ncbi:MAG: ACT domain-containing protein [Gammaproteobacteria bacterium]
MKDEAAEEESEKIAATQQLSKQPLLIKGTEGMVVTFAKCCYPIPGDVILGVFDAGKGITIHDEQCQQIAHLRNTEKCVYVNWQEDISGEFPVQINAELINQRGVLAALASAISASDANIENISVEERDGSYCLVKMTISIRDRDHLAQIMRRLRKLPAVSKLNRMK